MVVESSRSQKILYQLDILAFNVYLGGSETHTDSPNNIVTRLKGKHYRLLNIRKRSQKSKSQVSKLQPAHYSTDPQSLRALSTSRLQASWYIRRRNTFRYSTMPGKRPPLPRNVQISKKLSYLLRHGAEKEGLTFDSAGFINVQDILNNRNFQSQKVTFDEVRQIVAENDKQRFTFAPASETKNGVTNGQTAGTESSSSSDPKQWLIRANQGHSLKVEAEGLLKPITDDNIPETAVHGTTHPSWPAILSSGGLRPMKRNHVHFASGLPKGFNSLSSQNADEAAAPVISGMRKSSSVLIFLDIRKAMDSGMKFWRSDNGVILTEGNEDGVVPLDFFKRVEDRTGEGVLVEDGKVVKDAPASWSGKRKANS